MTDLDPARLAAIQARVDAASAGPWREGTSNVWRDDPLMLVADLTGLMRSDGNSQNNCRFIAHARDDIPYLLAVLARLQGENDGLRDANERLKANYISEGQFLAAARADVARLQAERDDILRRAEMDRNDGKRALRLVTDAKKAAEAARDEYRALAKVGTWHDGCRPNREQAARELQKSQAVIDKLADRIYELETARDEAQRALEECRRAGRPQYGTPEASTGAPTP